MWYSRFMIPTAVALLAACSESTGPDGDGTAKTARFTWSGQLAPAATVEVKNLNGDVRARPGIGGTVRVSALKEGEADHPSTVRVEVLETAQGVTICAVYPDVPGQPENQCLPGMAGQLSSHRNDVSVTFDIEVPEGCAFVAGTVAGDVETADLTAYVRARTMAGDIDIATSGLAEATTLSGNITASIGRAVWDRDLSFTALDGDVTVRVPAHTNADVLGSTWGGSISTDFPLSITSVGAWRHLRGRLGGGGRNLNIASSAGNLALLAK
jgi:hypothetical protein